MNFFIPDAKLFWTPFAFIKARKLIKAYKPDLIFSTAPPQTVNLIARLLKKVYKIPWVADFRDPWINIYHYDNLRIPPHRHFIEKWLESGTVKSAVAVVTVSKHFTDIIGNSAKKFRVIKNGFDLKDIPVKPGNISGTKFIMIHTGKLSPSQNVISLWKSLGKLTKKYPEFRKYFVLHFVGAMDRSIFESLNDNGLSDNLRMFDYQPHSEIFNLIGESAVCLVVNPITKNNLGIIPSKVYEYIAMSRTVLAVSPSDSDLAELINQNGFGKSFGHNDDSSEFTMELFNKWKSDRSSLYMKFNVSEFTREKLTADLADVFNDTVRNYAEISGSKNTKKIPY